jgi:hypothetical protein
MSGGFVGFHTAPVVRRDGVEVALVLATAGDYGFTSNFSGSQVPG